QKRSGSFAGSMAARAPTSAARMAARTVVALTTGSRPSAQCFGRRFSPDPERAPALVDAREQRDPQQLREGEERNRELATLGLAGPARTLLDLAHRDPGVAAARAEQDLRKQRGTPRPRPEA